MARGKLLILVFFSCFVVAAQTQPRDYSISLPRVRFSADGTTATVNFSVSNRGGDALEDSQFVIAENSTGRIEITEALPVLAAGEERAFSFDLRLADFAEEDLFFKIEAGIDEYELAGSPIARNNVQIFRINKAEVGDATGADVGIVPASPTYDLYLPLVNLGIDFLADGIAVNGNRYGSGELLRFGGVMLVALFCLWLLSLILRLVFRRPPKFEPWQPPYAVNNWHDPNSALGRRQSWQFHAQNSTISAAPAPNQVTVIKRLTDNAGNSLGGWEDHGDSHCAIRHLRTHKPNRSGHAAEDQQAAFSHRKARAEHGQCRIAQGNKAGGATALPICPRRHRKTESNAATGDGHAFGRRAG